MLEYTGNRPLPSPSQRRTMASQTCLDGHYSHFRISIQFCVWICFWCARFPIPRKAGFRFESEGEVFICKKSFSESSYEEAVFCETSSLWALLAVKNHPQHHHKPPIKLAFARESLSLPSNAKNETQVEKELPLNFGTSRQEQLDSASTQKNYGLRFLSDIEQANDHRFLADTLSLASTHEKKMFTAAHN
jgi:hypothetical protein